MAGTPAQRRCPGLRQPFKDTGCLSDALGMDHHDVSGFRRLLKALRLDDASAEFAAALGSGSESPDSLLVVGTPECEPWHFVAHLAEEARSTGRPDLVPTWVRWAPPAGARGHLAVAIDRLGAVRRGDTVLVVTPNSAGERLLDRVDDARRRGGRVMTLHREDHDLSELSHETLVVPVTAPTSTFDVVQHVVTSTASGQAVRLRHRVLRRSA